MPGFAHLSFRTLVPLSEGALSLGARQRDHLAVCEDCRTQLRELRALTACARAMAGPAPSDALLARIHERIDAGERVILPSWPVTRRSPVSRRTLGVMVACAAAVIAVVLWLARPMPVAEAGATTGDLEFTPRDPHPGDSVHVTYHAPARLDGERVLHLRARLHRPNDEPYGWTTSQRVVAELRLGADRLYRGALRLPDSIPYSVFAVEDTSGTRVDDHDRQLWEVLAHAPDGRPTYGALWQREQELIGRNMELALATSRRRAQLYPDLPYAWGELYAIESYNLGSSEQRTREYRARLAQLSDRWAAVPNPPFGVVNGLLGFAAQVSDGRDSLGRAVRDRWRPLREQATATDPTDPELVEARWWRLNELAMKNPDSARVALALAERFWSAAGRGSPVGAMVGWQIARFAGDTTAVRVRWADRNALVYAGRAEYLYAELSREPALRRVAIDRLTALVRMLRVPDDARRPLEMTRAAAARDDSARVRRVLGLLADARLATGDTAAARADFVEATAAGWDLTLIRHATSALLASGDASHAFVLAARLAADPGTPAKVVDSLARRVMPVVGAARWRAMLTDARRFMRDYLLADAMRMKLRSQIVLRDSADRPTTLAQVTHGRVSVVTFWSRTCAPSVAQLPKLAELAARLRERGMTLVPIATEPRSPELTTFLRDHPIGTTGYIDASSEARRAFGQWSTPEYFVLDEHGVVRFRHSALDLVLAQAVALADAGGE